MILIKKKILYNKFIKQKYIYSIYTYNRILYKKLNINLYKQKLYTIYIYLQDKNKLNIKHILGKAYRGIVNFCLVFNDLFFKNYFNMEIQYII